MTKQKEAKKKKDEFKINYFFCESGKNIKVTHVYVNDPTKGYAIFADTMIDELKKFNSILRKRLVAVVILRLKQI